MISIIKRPDVRDIPHQAYILDPFITEPKCRVIPRNTVLQLKLNLTMFLSVEAKQCVKSCPDIIMTLASLTPMAIG